MSPRQKEEKERALQPERYEALKNALQTTKDELEMGQFSFKEFKKGFDYTFEKSTLFLELAEKEHEKVAKRFKDGLMSDDEYAARIDDTYYAIHEIHTILINLTQRIIISPLMHVEENKVDALSKKYEFIRRALIKLKSDELSEA